MNIDQMLAELVQREGGYVNDPNDRGGETNYGITIAVARANGYTGAMRDLPLSTALYIYRRLYWTGPKFDRVAEHSESIAEEMFDTGVNMGPGVAAAFLQRALTALNRSGKDYPDLKPDGSIGPVTLDALEAYLRVRGAEGEGVLLKALDALQGERYIGLAERRDKNETFLYGWLRTRLGE
jgi:lysozyme family protein